MFFWTEIVWVHAWAWTKEIAETRAIFRGRILQYVFYKMLGIGKLSLFLNSNIEGTL